MIDIVTTIAIIIGILILFVIAVCVLIFVWAMIACWIDIYREDMQQVHNDECDKEQP